MAITAEAFGPDTPQNLSPTWRMQALGRKILFLARSAEALFLDHEACRHAM